MVAPIANPRCSIIEVSQVAIGRSRFCKCRKNYAVYIVKRFHKMNMGKTLKIAFLTAILFPIIIAQLSGVDTSGWDTTLVTIWDNLPIFIGLGVLFAFLKMGGLEKFGKG